MPDAPVLSASGGGSSISLTWTTPNDGGSSITDYRLYRGTAPGAESNTPLVDLPARSNSYQDGTAPSGGTSYYVVTAVNSVGESAQSSEASASLTPPPPPPAGGLVGNPGFETNLTGWSAGAGVSLTRTTTLAHSGNAAALLTLNTAGNDTLLNDSPNWNAATTAGTTCTVSAWVFGPANPTGALSVKIRLREYAGSTNVGSATGSVTLPANPGWVSISVSMPVVGGGDSLDLNVYGKGLSVAQTLAIDDVSETCQ